LGSLVCSDGFLCFEASCSNRRAGFRPAQLKRVRAPAERNGLRLANTDRLADELPSLRLVFPDEKRSGGGAGNSGGRASRDISSARRQGAWAGPWSQRGAIGRSGGSSRAGPVTREAAHRAVTAGQRFQLCTTGQGSVHLSLRHRNTEKPPVPARTPRHMRGQVPRPQSSRPRKNFGLRKPRSKDRPFAGPSRR